MQFGTGAQQGEIAVVRGAAVALAAGDSTRTPAAMRVSIARVAVSLVVPMRSIAPATVRIGWSGRSPKRPAAAMVLMFGKVCDRAMEP